jgi:hypothetical protein
MLAEIVERVALRFAPGAVPAELTCFGGPLPEGDCLTSGVFACDCKCFDNTGRHTQLQQYLAIYTDPQIE